MILVQLSAGQGPAECGRAISLALQTLKKAAEAKGLKVTLVEAVPNKERKSFKSLLLEIDFAGSDSRHSQQIETLRQFANQWQGGMLWVCESPFRPKHKRKNWFFSGQVFEFNESSLEGEIEYQTCRASGAGGQHVNTTDSAVRATHLASGITVRVETERSQHANKRLAKALIFQKLEEVKRVRMSEQDKNRWQQHQELQRGNPVKIFKGEKFSLVL